MFKKLFRIFAGGRVRPEIAFTCRGIKSELVINLTLKNILAHRGIIKKTGCGRWQIRIDRPTAFLSVVHKNILKERGMA